MPNRIINIKSKSSVQILNKIKSFNWYLLDYKSTSYVVTTLTVKRSTAKKYQKIIKAYAKENGLQDIEVKTQGKHNLLYMTRDSFECFFSLDSIKPSTSQASEQLQTLFSDNANDKLSKTDQQHLDNIPNLTWYSYKKDSSILLIADLTSYVDNGNNIANYYSSAINRFSRQLQRENEIKASHQSNHNLLIIDENSFKNYFSARYLNCPNTIPPAPEDLIMRFYDKKMKKISEHDHNNLDKLASLNWFHLDENNVRYILTILENGSDNLNHLVTSISHVGNVSEEPLIKGASIRKHSIIYLKKEAFDMLFEYIKKPKPKTQPADNALQEKFAKRRKRDKLDQKILADKELSKSKILNKQPSDDTLQKKLTKLRTLVELDKNQLTNEFSKCKKSNLIDSPTEIFLNTSINYETTQCGYLVKFDMSIKSLVSQPEPQMLEPKDREVSLKLIF